MEKILIVDDEKNMRMILSKILKNAGYEIYQAESGKQALREVKKSSSDLVLLDLKLPDINGIEVLEKIKQHDNSIIVIMLTAYGDIKNAVEAMKLGAYDYLKKPFDNEEMILVIEKALENLRLSREVKLLRDRLDEKISIKEMMGESAQIRKVIKLVEQVASTNMSVFLEGKTGTGKELIARMIHQKSHRKDGPFIAVDCGAIPESLFESELFGHEKGAFTDAISTHIGKFEQANGGTLFLDEINNLPLNLQPKFLRALEEKAIQRLGGKGVRQIDVRIVIASSMNIVDKMGKGEFRDDLFYRLSEFKIDIPSLWQRKDDIPTIANYFLKRACIEMKKNINGFTTEAMNSLIDYQWPGNVRELKNVVKRAVLLAQDDYIKKEHLIFITFDKRVDEFDIISSKINEQLRNSDTSLQSILEKVEIDILKKALKISDGKKTKAAKMLGLSRYTLYRKLKLLGLV
ncbi:MAG: sigma-54-dependent Fis family transcriptional regulator [Candidatus Cloacimonetes bacterium]|nr:sigma-54-dependent Fis family transcriptional regulator [Candidatus Cloacimonadota bacterium]